jgi:hypothetical protein
MTPREWEKGREGNGTENRNGKERKGRTYGVNLNTGPVDSAPKIKQPGLWLSPHFWHNCSILLLIEKT